MKISLTGPLRGLNILGRGRSNQFSRQPEATTMSNVYELKTPKAILAYTRAVKNLGRVVMDSFIDIGRVATAVPVAILHDVEELYNVETGRKRRRENTDDDMVAPAAQPEDEVQIVSAAAEPGAIIPSPKRQRRNSHTIVPKNK